MLWGIKKHQRLKIFLMDINDLKLDYLVAVTIKGHTDEVLAQVVELNGDYTRFSLIGDNGGLEIDTTNSEFVKWCPIPLNFNHLKIFGFRHSHSNAYALKIGNNYMIAWIANFESITGIDVFVNGKAKEKYQFDYLHEIQDEINDLNLLAIQDLNDDQSKM